MSTPAEIQARYAAIREKTYGKPKRVNISVNPPVAPVSPPPAPLKKPTVAVVERQPDEFDLLRQQKDFLRAEIAELKRLKEEAGEELSAETKELRSQIASLRLHLEALEKKSITMRYITQKIARYTGFTERDLKSDRRHRQLALIRKACWYWIVRRTECSYPMVARHFNRDHTTVLHGVAVYPEQRMKRGRHLRKIKR